MRYKASAFDSEEVSKVVGQDHVYITRAGCVISSHCGPGTIGVLYIKK